MTAAPQIKKASQLSLPKVRVTIEEPLIKLNAARAILKCPDDEIIKSINGVDILWAWNIGLGDYRSEVRLLAKDVEDLSRIRKDEPLERISEKKMLWIVFARDPKPFILSPRLQVLFDCKSELVIDLIEDGELKLVKGTTYHPGRGCAAVITRESVIQFLKRRKL